MILLTHLAAIWFNLSKGRPDAPYVIILLCLMPDDFTCQGESAATQWVVPRQFYLSGKEWVTLTVSFVNPLTWEYTPPLRH
jgi:hypothetical protein